MRNLVSRSAFQDKFVHFQENNDVTAVVRNIIWCTFFQLSINLVCRVILPKFDVILTIRSRVCTWIIHFTTDLVIFEVNDDVTVAVRSRFLHLFWTKMVIDILKISLAKFELILKRRSRVWTWIVHFAISLCFFVSIMTSLWRSEAGFYRKKYFYFEDWLGEVWSDSGKYITKFHFRSGSNAFFLDFSTMFIPVNLSNRRWRAVRILAVSSNQS